MSHNPTILSYRFFNFNKKNQFLKIVQQKWFEVISENQTVLNATTKWWMSWWAIWDSYSVNTKTENLVAYDINIKKSLDDEDKKYIDLVAEYINYSWEKDLGLIVWMILGYTIGFILLACVSIPIGYLFWENAMNRFIQPFGIYFFFATWPIFFIYFIYKNLKKGQRKNKLYQAKLKPYLQWISF